MNDYEVEFYDDKQVADFARLSILEVSELDYIDYLTFRRDAHIYNLNQSQAGREYLDNAWMLTQTKPDKGSLRNHFSRG